MGRRLVLVKGISLLGKNRIKEHGHMWYEDAVNDVAYNRKVKLTSVKSGYSRWLDHHDKDFVVEKVWDGPLTER